MMRCLLRLPRGAAALVAIAALLIFGAGDVARAQDPVSDFFQGLFGGGRQYRPQHYPPSVDNQRMRRLMPHREYGAPSYWRGQPRAAKKPKAQKAGGDNPAVAPSFVIAVIGDSLGQTLADGLEEAYIDRPDIRVLHKAKESSGLVRADFYDWAKSVRELLAGGDKIDVAVMIIGSNDRQAIHEGAETFEPLSPRWRELYAARIEAVRAAFREKKIPLVWVGLPVMKSEHFSIAMAQLNEIYRTSATADGGPFVDVWEAFADEKNQYQAFGPDINGRIAKLRAGDGVHFTDAGARKLAHFVEGEIKRLIDAKRSAGAETPAAPPPESPAPEKEARPPVAVIPPIVAPGERALGAAPALPERPAVGPVQPLTATASADGELARRSKSASPATDPHSAAARALVEHIFVDGGDQLAHPGRADDFSWPKGEAGNAAPPPPR
jgi:hypothetical protein